MNLGLMPTARRRTLPAPAPLSTQHAKQIIAQCLDLNPPRVRHSNQASRRAGEIATGMFVFRRTVAQPFAQGAQEHQGQACQAT